MGPPLQSCWENSDCNYVWMECGSQEWMVPGILYESLSAFCAVSLLCWHNEQKSFLIWINLPLVLLTRLFCLLSMIEICLWRLEMMCCVLHIVELRKTVADKAAMHSAPQLLQSVSTKSVCSCFSYVMAWHMRRNHWGDLFLKLVFCPTSYWWTALAWTDASQCFEPDFAMHMYFSQFGFYSKCSICRCTSFLWNLYILCSGEVLVRFKFQLLLPSVSQTEA